LTLGESNLDLSGSDSKLVWLAQQLMLA
jgi:hypothetical protein